MPAEATAEHGDPPGGRRAAVTRAGLLAASVASVRALGEMADRRGHVAQRALAGEAAHELEAGLAPLLVLGQLDPRPGAVVEVGRDRHVAQLRDALGDVADVGGHAEHLHRDDDAGEWALGGRAGEVGSHRRRAALLGDRELDALGDDVVHADHGRSRRLAGGDAQDPGGAGIGEASSARAVARRLRAAVLPVEIDHSRSSVVSHSSSPGPGPLFQ